jgi:hypothetical protein
MLRPGLGQWRSRPMCCLNNEPLNMLFSWNSNFVEVNISVSVRYIGQRIGDFLQQGTSTNLFKFLPSFLISITYSSIDHSVCEYFHRKRISYFAGFFGRIACQRRNVRCTNRKGALEMRSTGSDVSIVKKNRLLFSDRNQDIQLRHFLSAFPRLVARLRDYAAYTYLQFLASALLLHKKYLLLI